MPRKSSLAVVDEGDATVSLVSRDGRAGDAPWCRVGDILDCRYRLERVLGRGATGVVFEATHLAIGGSVAVKVVPSGTTSSRLRREARIVSRLRGEHLARVMDFGSLPNGGRYLVMERLVGEDVAEVLRARESIPFTEAVDWILEACEAIAEAHAAGVVHRDLKPSNLFLAQRADGTTSLKVLDFGVATAGNVGDDLASLTGAASMLGSPRYMAPEQVRSAPDVDARADVWALGVILHELIAGAPPFRGDSVSAVLAAVAADVPVSLGEVGRDVPAGLTAVVSRCLEKDRERRVPSVAALADALAPFASRASMNAPGKFAMTRDASRRRYALGAVLAVVVSLTVVGLWTGGRSAPSTAPAAAPDCPAEPGEADPTVAPKNATPSDPSSDSATAVPAATPSSLGVARNVSRAASAGAHAAKARPPKGTDVEEATSHRH